MTNVVRQLALVAVKSQPNVESGLTALVRCWWRFARRWRVSAYERDFRAAAMDAATQ